MAHDPLLNTIEAAAELGLAPHTLENKRSRGVGPAFVKMDGAVRYRLSALQRYVDECTQERTLPRRMRRRAS